MTSDQMRRVQSLFDAAVDECPANLDAWLDRAGESDATVRAELRSLIDHHARAGSFLVEPVASAAVLEELEGLQPGTTVGPYVIQRELGRGGMGRVYVASDSRLGRSVALKAIAPRFTRDERYRARLRREARAAAVLTDPGVCAIYALEEIDGQLFIASEFVNGRTLREEIDDGELPSSPRAAATARDLAVALANAHANGVTHRDLKPANIMRSRDGRLKVLDFGLARIDQDPSATASIDRAVSTLSGGLAGTPAYMAPEQLNGLRVDARADVFAFGIVLYEYLTGVHPFDGRTAVATTARILEVEPMPLLSRRPELPPVLAAVVHRCLCKAPEHRYASGQELVIALAESAAPQLPQTSRAWWRIHQVAILVLYVAACAGAWRLDELGNGSITRMAFVTLGVVATVGGVLRGHLLFMERVHPTQLRAESSRTRRLQIGTDLVFGFVLFISGAAVSGSHAVIAVLAMALAVGVSAAALLIEPSTFAAAFLPPDSHR